MAQKPSIPKGTRDFIPGEMNRRNYIFDTIKSVFGIYGYAPIETPAMENLSTLLGKYGDEGDKLLFKVLNSGNYLSKINDVELATKDSGKLSTRICEKGLRYDLTVPFARFVVQHRNELTFPFKRYQIQNVWRADRPQKGRYREFFQCDVDIIGSNSLLNELELIQIIDEVFNRLKLNVVTKINNRKILSGVAEIIGQAEKIVDITVAIDKLEKIGLVGVNKELAEKGIPQEAIDKLQPIINLKGSNDEKLAVLKNVLAVSEIGLQGIAEMEQIFYFLKTVSVNCEVELDLTLARGLNYYTGAIFEVKSKDVSMGSICGGGRYDDLTGVFGLKDVSGVGISFGADRIYDVIEQLNAFPQEAIAGTNLMFVNFGEKEEAYCLPLLVKVREAGISAEIYPDRSKMKKQMSYANANNIPYVAIAGTNEIESAKITLKNMETGEQEVLKIEELIEILTDKLNIK
ncbi:MAG: histidine--tRNA ligase [Bacteroidota bacterium]|nr:histidine--tRNA ligase [Bacteroidota bacterium]